MIIKDSLMNKHFSEKEIEHLLFKDENKLKELWGDAYFEFLLKQYCIYMDLTDKQGSKRDVQNSFFLALHTLIVTGIGFCINYLSDAIYFPIILSLLGLCFAATWQKLLVTSRVLKDVSYRLIHIFESRMPVSGFSVQYKLLSDDSKYKAYIPFTRIEEKVPLLFALSYIFLIGFIFYTH